MDKNPSIKCSVNSCRYNDKASYCTLNSIMVGGNGTDGNHAHVVKDTECDSFMAEQ